MFKKIKKALGIAILVFFVLALIFIMVARISGNTPSLFGYSMLRVSSDSMEPELKVGSIILVKDEDPANLQKGDVITYHGEKGSVAGKLITHQIVAEPYEEDGTYYFTTRGIRSGAIDDPEIEDRQIVGKVLFKIPILGSLYDFFTSSLGLIAIIALIIIAFSTELMNLIGIIRGKDEDVDHDIPVTAADPVYDDSFETSIQMETDSIITNLDDDDM
ncbi:MAG: signal peptidase I [Ruminococcus sp.]|nr:signal peptidase I [Ruminococcus sp.]